MKKIFLILFSLLGWFLFIVFLSSSFLFNQFSTNNNGSKFSPIAWEDHKTIFEGALVCSLTSEAETERRVELKNVIFKNVVKKEEFAKGYRYYFNDDKELLVNVMELIAKEKECCPFFKFDISILPFKKGFAIQVSGNEEVKEFLNEFETAAI